MTLEHYIGETILLKYENKYGWISEHSGIITAVTVQRVVFLAIVDDGDEDREILIPIKNIKKICKPKEL